MIRRTRRTLLGAFVLCAIGAAAAPSAFAINPAYSGYHGCPNVSTVFSCLRADTRSGYLRIGSITTPINKTQTLNGGTSESPDGVQFSRVTYSSTGGLLGDALEVPGGLAGLTGLSEVILNVITLGANKVYADAETVAPARVNLSNLDLRLPIRVRLRNPFLVSTCAIGSAASPITLNLTTGTTAPPPPARPISGHEPTVIGGGPDINVLQLLNTKLVDNTFSVPAASGCDLLGFGLINGLVNSRVGLPSAAGRNEAVFDQTDIRLVAREVVYP